MWVIRRSRRDVVLAVFSSRLHRLLAIEVSDDPGKRDPAAVVPAIKQAVRRSTQQLRSTRCRVWINIIRKRWSANDLERV